MKVLPSLETILVGALLVGFFSTPPAHARSNLESNAREALLEMEVRIARAELAAANARVAAAHIRARIEAVREAKRDEVKRRTPAETPAAPADVDRRSAPAKDDVAPTVAPEPKAAPAKQPPAPPRDPAPPAVEEPDLDQPVPLGEANPVLMVRAILDATNVARGEHGLAALEPNATLHRAATGHARRMVEGNFFSHHDPEIEALRTPSDRVGAAGAANPQAAENIITEVAIEYESGENVYVRDRAKGHFSRTAKGPILPRHTYRSFAQSVVQRWMNSPGHRKNILAKDALQIGIGTAFRNERGFPTFVAVQNFQWYAPIKPKPDAG